MSIHHHLSSDFVARNASPLARLRATVFVPPCPYGRSLYVRIIDVAGNVCALSFLVGMIFLIAR